MLQIYGGPLCAASVYCSIHLAPPLKFSVLHFSVLRIRPDWGLLISSKICWKSSKIKNVGLASAVLITMSQIKFKLLIPFYSEFIILSLVGIWTRAYHEASLVDASRGHKLNSVYEFLTIKEVSHVLPFICTYILAMSRRTVIGLVKNGVGMKPSKMSIIFMSFKSQFLPFKDFEPNI